MVWSESELTIMGKMMMLQQSQPSFSLFTSSLSDFNGAKLHLQVQCKRKKVNQPKRALYVSASNSDNGRHSIHPGSLKEGHQVTLFTRGKYPIAKQLPGDSDQDFADFSSKILHLKGDRKDYDFVKSKGYDVVYDINGREAEEVEPIIDALPELEQHKGKLETESFLQSKGVNWTSISPVYTYGPLNYNPVEEWFFHRLKAGRPIPVPNSGRDPDLTTRSLLDLATAFLAVLGNEKASKEILNISGEKYVTFDGLARACAKAGGFPEPEIVHYNPKEFDFGKKKAFPFRDQHFFASVEKAKHVLGWKPEFDLVEGLTDSYKLDFGRGTFRKEADFTTDDMILSKKHVTQS
ncbi:hypothetical protein HID58_083747 [Brassica napus]|uniref:Chloroplast stem-loop binding protein of 41 kDa b, chloroplastic n=1 Tax=Brassica napus TaxID=3708 RepID=A0ABQ7YEH2_BRANA|nr:hypothetical protein HID58_083747 [Brassica napus]